MTEQEKIHFKQVLRMLPIEIDVNEVAEKMSVIDDWRERWSSLNYWKDVFDLGHAGSLYGHQDGEEMRKRALTKMKEILLCQSNN